MIHSSAAVFLLFLLFCTLSSIATAKNVSTNAKMVQDGKGVNRLRSVWYRSHIFFSADNKASLYVNGVHKLTTSNWGLFGYVSAYLKYGDVVSIIASDYGGWYGVVAQLNINGNIVTTGRDDWRAVRKFTSSNTWMMPSYSVCKWERPYIVDRECNINRGGGRAYRFPVLTAAKYVWVKSIGAHQTIFLRYRVGGEHCYNKYTIYFAADNAASLYVNGHFKSSITHWPSYKTYHTYLKHGDVVSIIATDYGVWYGAITAIVRDGSTVRYVTGKDEWRATRSFSIYGNKNAWMLPEYDACAWDIAGPPAPGGSTSHGMAAGFPYASTGASYVWAKGAGVRNTIFLRFRIGGGC